MSRFLIEGGRPLNGTIEVAANKNAILPMMAASLITDGDCVIKNVPAIADVYVMADLLRSVGATVEFADNRTLKINTENVSQWVPDERLVERLRASVLLAGPLLARFGRWKMHHPGGDISIGTRSIRSHLKAFHTLGADVHSASQQYDVSCTNPQPGTVFLDEASVTATRRT